jgi:hypothetical protein
MANLHVLWDSMDMAGKQRLLKLCFPSGIFYHKEIGNYRTTKINPALALMTSLCRPYDPNIEPKFLRECQKLHELAILLKSRSIKRPEINNC